MKAFTVCHAIQQDQTGTAINEHLIPIIDPTVEGGVRFIHYISVLWDDRRNPSPSMHGPEDLIWLDIPRLMDEGENEEEFIDDEEEESNEDEAEESEDGDETTS